MASASTLRGLHLDRHGKFGHGLADCVDLAPADADPHASTLADLELQPPLSVLQTLLHASRAVTRMMR
jgi:hypothetical protein